MQMGDQGAKPEYEALDIATKGPAAVRPAFANQVAYCTANGAPITARICAAVLAAVESAQSCTLLERIRQWQGAPLADAMPLRIAGGLHALHLAGAAPQLAPIYRGEAADDNAIIADVIRQFEAQLLPWLDGPPQTNEAGRSSNFIAALLWLAGRGLPGRFECIEIGSSAGINLMIDRYAYDLAGVNVGRPDAAMQFAPQWLGPPPPDRAIEFASLKGCDIAPVDLTDPSQALRLKAYIWPEHTVRFARLEAAIAAATAQPPNLVKANAADFVEAELARPQPHGTTRVLMHSIVWQYVPEDQQQRVTAAMEAAGNRARPDAPLAWIALEANRTVHRHELRLSYWPGGEHETLLARAHAHGAEIEWLAD